MNSKFKSQLSLAFKFNACTDALISAPVSGF